MNRLIAMHRSGAFILSLLATITIARDAMAQAVAHPASSSASASSQSRSTAADAPGDLITDRPDFTESSEVVGRGVIVIETGFTFEGDASEGLRARSIATPSMLARIGIGTRAELRLSGDGFLTGWTVGQPGSSTPGYSDLEVGAKVKLLDRERFDVAMIPSVSIPTRNRHFSSLSYDPALKLTWATPLSNRMGLAGNLNYSQLSREARRYDQSAVSLTLGRDFSSDWGAYGEIYGLTALKGPGSAAGWTANGGVTRAVGRHLQLDVEAGRGITSAAPDWFAAFGFAIRRVPFGR